MGPVPAGRVRLASSAAPSARSSASPTPGILHDRRPGGGSDTGLIRVATTPLALGSLAAAATRSQCCYTNAGIAGRSAVPARSFGSDGTIDDRTRPDGDPRRRPPRRRVAQAGRLADWSASDNTGIRPGNCSSTASSGRRSRLDLRRDAARSLPERRRRTDRPARRRPTARTRSSSLRRTRPATRRRCAKSVDVDGNGPAVIVSRASGKTITVSVSDGASGVAGGTISVRNSPSEPFRVLPTSLSEGGPDRQARSRRCRARGDRGQRDRQRRQRHRGRAERAGAPGRRPGA